MAHIKIKNKTYNLKMGINAMIAYEEITGKSIDSLGKNNPGVSDMRALFHVSLVGGDKTYKRSLEETGCLLDSVIADEGFDFVAKTLETTMNEALGNEKRRTAHPPNLKK